MEGRECMQWARDGERHREREGEEIHSQRSTPMAAGTLPNSKRCERSPKGLVGFISHHGCRVTTRLAVATSDEERPESLVWREPSAGTGRRKRAVVEEKRQYRSGIAVGTRLRAGWLVPGLERLPRKKIVLMFCLPTFCLPAQSARAAFSPSTLERMYCSTGKSFKHWP